MADHRQVSRQYKHRRGQAVTHLGRRRHGVDDISEGHRVNLIMWNHNREYRRSPQYVRRKFHKESGKPSALCVSYTYSHSGSNLALAIVVC